MIASRTDCRLPAFALGDPAGFGGLAAAAEAQRVGGDVLGDAGAGGYVGVVADIEGGYEGGVGANEGVVSNSGGVFVDAVVVAGDGAGAYVYAGADDGVSKIGKVVGLGAAADCYFFGFDEVADVGFFADVAFGAEMGVRA